MDLEISTQTVIKLASIAVHAEELADGVEADNYDGVSFDIAAIRGLLADDEVADCLVTLNESAFLPVKR